MNSFERTLIEKAGYAHGFENVRESTPERVVLYSALHKAEAHVSPTEKTIVWRVTFPKGPPFNELVRTWGCFLAEGNAFQVNDERSLGRLLRRAAELATALPNQAAEDYAAEVAKIEAHPPTTTEVLALVKQRRGQELFRKALMEYWDGACSVTSISVPALLRASHTKPWADCATDQERLNVFNGFLLCAHLDALFDSGLMTFNEHGTGIWSEALNAETRSKLGLESDIQLRWLAPEHLPFLSWHRSHVFQDGRDDNVAT